MNQALAGQGLCTRDKFRIALVLALKGKKIVVAASLRFWIFTAHAWPLLVDRAASFFLVEQNTRRSEYLVPSMTEKAYAARWVRSGVALFGLFVGYFEMPSYPLYIRSCDFDFRIAAAVSWALRGGIRNADGNRKRFFQGSALICVLPAGRRSAGKTAACASGSRPARQYRRSAR